MSYDYITYPKFKEDILIDDISQSVYIKGFENDMRCSLLKFDYDSWVKYINGERNK